MTSDKGGQPPYYANAEDMKVKIDDYFDTIDNLNKDEFTKPPTVTGLALHLGFCSRQSLIDYENKGAFFDTVKRAKSRIEQFNEEMLYRDGQVTGTIFNLKNNFKWRDKSEVDNTNKNIDINSGSIDKERVKEINAILDELI